MFFFLVFYMSLISNTLSFINNALLRSCESNKLREFLREEMNKSYNYISYTKAKYIMHNNICNMDIYGDNSQDKNLEHIFPQYSFKNDENKKILKSDMHNLYLCNTKLNTYRQNFKYIDSKDANISNNSLILDRKGEKVSSPNDLFKKTGYLMVSNKKKRTFIPNECSRGKIARSLSYFAIKYNYLEELKNIIDIKTLLEWNLKDPVDEKEYLKNIMIYKYQNNINPFILEPDLILYCFSDMYNIDDTLLQKKRYSTISPMYLIEHLINEIKEFEKNKLYNDKLIKKILKR
jgi:endonuclease I